MPPPRTEKIVDLPTPPATAPPALEVVGLGMRFGRRRVFSAVEFSLSRGDCMVVAGRNGAGKSTLLRVLAGLIRPTSGQVRLSFAADTGITYGSCGTPEELRQHVGMCAPDLELYSELTAAENITFYSAVRGLACTRNNVLEALDRVALADRADDRVSAFSSGMKQRLRLLFAIRHRPPLLLLDEPGSNLDQDGRELVAEIVREQLAAGIVILATNDRREMVLGRHLLQLDPIPEPRP